MRYTHVGRTAVLVFCLFLISACSDSTQQSQSDTPQTTTTAPDTRSADTEPSSGVIDAQAKTQTAKAECHLTMGWDPWAPYQYLTVDGQVEGLDVEIVRAAAAKTGCEVSFEQGDWASLLSALRSGEIDLLTGATRTPSRESFAQFSAPYRAESFVLYVRRDEVDNYTATSLETLLENGFRLGVTEGYIYGEQVSGLQQHPVFSEQFVDASIGELNYARLVDLEIDGFLEDPFVAATTLRRKGWGDDIEAHPLQISAGEVHMMFSRESVSDELVEGINNSLQGMRSDGSYQAMLDKYAQ